MDKRKYWRWIEVISTLIIICAVFVDCTEIQEDQKREDEIESTAVTARGGWVWEPGQFGVLDKIASILTFLALGVFLINLLLNALLLGTTVFGLLPTDTDNDDTGTGGGTGTGTGGTATSAPVIVTGGGGGNGGISITSGGVSITGAGMGNGGVSVGRSRPKRSPFLQLRLTTITNPSFVADTMSREMMEMIEAVTSLEDDKCLSTLLCQKNHRAVIIRSGFQYLMPICTMGLSYWKKNFSNFLDAIYDGVEEVNCNEKYGVCYFTDKH